MTINLAKSEIRSVLVLLIICWSLSYACLFGNVDNSDAFGSGLIYCGGNCVDGAEILLYFLL